MTSVARRYQQNGRQQQGTHTHVSAQQQAQTSSPVILMVSGGADSTALLVLAVTGELDIDDGRGTARIARERLHVLHVNHQLRGEAADEDERFVCSLAERYGIACTVKRIDVAQQAQNTGDNVENAGRELRYKAAQKLANELSDAWGTSRSLARIVTAHTADDRAETFMMNAIKGSGVSGLSSIPRRRNRIVRPLLSMTHDELCAYLEQHGIDWREDATNSDTHYLRAYVRHELLPVAKQRNPKLATTLSQSCDILSDEDAYLTGLARQALHKLERRRDLGVLALDAARLSAMEVALARRVIRAAVLSLEPEARIEAQHINNTLALVAAGRGSLSICFGMSCKMEYGLLIIRSRQDEKLLEQGWLNVPAYSVDVHNYGSLAVNESYELRARLIKLAPDQDAESLARAQGMRSRGSTVLLDAEAAGIGGLGGRLWVDAPQPGDIFFPLGMRGQSKKLSDYLNEMHVAAQEKKSVAIVRTEPRGSVVWVSRFRADERARCTQNTRLLLELSIRTL